MPFCACEIRSRGYHSMGVEPMRPVLFASGVPADLSQIGCPCGGGCPRCVPSFADGKSSAGRGKSRREECSAKCGGTELGSTECEIDSATGLPNGKVTVAACMRPCVAKHEEVHAAEVGPICKAVRKCLDAAGRDNSKQDRCLDAYESGLWKRIAGPQGTECKAYTAEEKCLEQRRKAEDCAGKSGAERLKAALARVRCYRKCFCKE